MTGAAAADVQGHADSTHWTGWYSVYGPCKNDAQMHWRYFYPGHNEFSRHYWRGRLSASTHTGWYLRLVGYETFTTGTAAYGSPPVATTGLGPTA